MLSAELPLLGSLSFWVLVALFLWPGLRAVQLVDRARSLSLGGSAALGWLVAFGAFSALSGPLLLTHRPTSWALSAALALWALALVVLELAHRRWPRPAPEEPPDAEPGLRLPAGRWGWGALALLLLTLFAAWLLVGGAVSRKVGAAACALVLLGNLAFAGAAWRRGALRELEPTPALPWLGRLAGVATLLLLAFLLVGTTINVREDADDVLYLSQALELQDSPAMGRYDPTHRGEQLPANEIYAWCAFELWGALLSRLAGVHPLIAFRTLLAPLALLCAVLLYRELLRCCLPGWAVPLALLVLLAYFAGGMSSHWTAVNYLLPRPAQGKSWLMHVGLPGLLLAAQLLLTRLRPGAWGLLFLASCACLGLAPIAVILVPAALAPFLLVYLGQERSKGAFLQCCAAGSVVVPQLGFGLLARVRETEALRDLAWGYGVELSWPVVFLAHHLNGYEGGGGALEMSVLLLLPLLVLLPASRAAWRYPVGLTLVFFCTFGNPILFKPLAALTTGTNEFHRYFWAVPFGVLLGVVAAAAVALAARTRFPRLTAGLALAACLGAFPLVGARPVWSAANIYWADAEIHPPPYRSSNPYKVPRDLLRVAQALEPLPLGPERRILCSERAACHLAPLVPAFDFVYTRFFQTVHALHAAGRPLEAVERERLARQFLHGHFPAEQAPALLARSRTAYVILEHARPVVTRVLRDAGYRPLMRAGRYRLWVQNGL